jgi:hypothetical protein
MHNTKYDVPLSDWTKETAIEDRKAHYLSCPVLKKVTDTKIL